MLLGNLADMPAARRPSHNHYHSRDRLSSVLPPDPLGADLSPRARLLPFGLFCAASQSTVSGGTSHWAAHLQTPTRTRDSAPALILPTMERVSRRIDLGFHRIVDRWALLRDRGGAGLRKDAGASAAGFPIS